MKIVDKRDGTEMSGELIATLPANQPVSEHDMRRFYKSTPNSRNYRMLAAPVPHDRLVLLRGDWEDAAYYIVPRYEFYEVME